MSDVLHKDRLEEAYELLKDADPRWVNTILRMTRMAAGKGKDYGNDEDNLANLTACKSMGIEPWVGVTIRMRDKEQRIDSFLTTGELENESLEDAIWDSAVYSAHRATLYEEGLDGEVAGGTPPFPWDEEGWEARLYASVCADDNDRFVRYWVAHNGPREWAAACAFWVFWHEADCP